MDNFKTKTLEYKFGETFLRRYITQEDHIIKMLISIAIIPDIIKENQFVFFKNMTKTTKTLFCYSPAEKKLKTFANHSNTSTYPLLLVQYAVVWLRNKEMEVKAPRTRENHRPDSSETP